LHVFSTATLTAAAALLSTAHGAAISPSSSSSLFARANPSCYGTENDICTFLYNADATTATSIAQKAIAQYDSKESYFVSSKRHYKDVMAVLECPAAVFAKGVSGEQILLWIGSLSGAGGCPLCGIYADGSECTVELT
jgi:hypothetical protein